MPASMKREIALLAGVVIASRVRYAKTGTLEAVK